MRFYLMIGLIFASKFYVKLDSYDTQRSMIRMNSKDLLNLTFDSGKLKSKDTQDINIIEKIYETFKNLCLSKYEIPKELDCFLNIKLYNLNKDEKIAVLSLRLVRNMLSCLKCKNDKGEVNGIFLKELEQALEDYKEFDDIEYDDGLQNLLRQECGHIYLSYNKNIPSFMCKDDVSCLSANDYIEYLKTIKKDFYIDLMERYDGLLEGKEVSTFSDISYIDIRDTFLINLNRNLNIENLKELELFVNQKTIDLFVRLFSVLSRLYKYYIGLNITKHQNDNVIIQVDSMSNVSKFEKLGYYKPKETKRKYYSQVNLSKRPSFLKKIKNKFVVRPRRDSFGSTPNLFTSKVLVSDCNDSVLMSTFTSLTSLLVSHQKTKIEFKKKMNQKNKKQITEIIQKIVTNEDQVCCSGKVFNIFNSNKLKMLSDSDLKHLCKLLRANCVSDFDSVKDTIIDSHEQISNVLSYFNQEDLVEYITTGNDGDGLFCQVKFRDFVKDVGVGKIAISFLEWFHLPVFYKKPCDLLVNLNKSTDVMKNSIEKYCKTYRNILIRKVQYKYTKPDEYTPLCHYTDILFQNKIKLERENMIDMMGDCLIYLNETKQILEENFSEVFFAISEYLQNLFILLDIKNQQNYFWLDKWCLNSLNSTFNYLSNKKDIFKMNSEANPDISSQSYFTVEIKSENVTTVIPKEEYENFSSQCGRKRIIIKNRITDGCSEVFLDEWMRYILDRSIESTMLIY